MSKTNLAEDTENQLLICGYTTDDIDWIGCIEFIISSRDFWTIAQDTYYDNGYGFAEIPGDLIIMLKDGTWFERAQYDGSEWWRHVKQPKTPLVRRKVVASSFAESDSFGTVHWNRLYEYCGKENLPTYRNYL